MQSTVTYHQPAPSLPPVITPERSEFLSERKTGIGGSDAAIILGLSPYKSPLELAEEKLGLSPPFEGNRFTEAGNRLEDVIAQWYADERGCKVARANQTFRLKEHDFIMAHIDRRVLNERKLLECKSADKWTLHNWGEPGTDEVPDAYFIQVQHYLLFPNWDYADLAALIGGNDLRIYPIIPDGELQAMILEAEIAFWKILERGDLPDPIRESDANRLWKHDNGERIYADYAVMEWHEELKRNLASRKELDAKIDDLKTKIKSFMQEYTVLCDPEGKKLHTWKVQKTSGFNEKELKDAYPEVFTECLQPKFDRNLCKQQYPEIYADYQSTGRVFR
jgi:putative phage-type endonuclease